MSRKFKVIVVGDSTVGKTSVVNYYVDRVACTDFVSTVGVDFRNKTLKIDSEEVTIQLWDTAGQEKFRSITKSYFRRADAISLIFNVNDRDTFRDISDWMKSIDEQMDKKVPIVLIGNKLDLGQEITYQEVEELAEKYNVQFFFTSAKTGEGIEECFTALAHAIVENLKKPKEPEEEDIKIDKYSEKKSGGKDCC